jgi:hypothetical protein
MEYPKINSLYKREGCGEFDETKKRYICDLEKRPRKSAIIEGEYACEEFKAINKWTVTEKVDGTNVRIIFQRPALDRTVCKLDFRGRTDNAQFPTFLFTYLQETFTLQKMDEIFKDSNYVILFGEGYGPKIQSGGYYRKDPSFILFDIYCSGWWFTRDSVAEVAQSLGIDHVPLLYTPIDKGFPPAISPYWTTEKIVEYVKSKPKSKIATVQEYEMEGIVARSEPQMLFRKGGPIMFKLKCKDFE